jgi:acyl carrier protein
MNESEIRTRVVAVIKSIAPEVEEGELRADRPLRDQVDLDSMDWLNVLVAIHEKVKVDIPEADYRKLVTLNDIVAYVGAKLAARV